MDKEIQSFQFIFIGQQYLEIYVSLTTTDYNELQTDRLTKSQVYHIPLYCQEIDNYFPIDEQYLIPLLLIY